VPKQSIAESLVLHIQADVSEVAENEALLREVQARAALVRILGAGTELRRGVGAIVMFGT